MNRLPVGGALSFTFEADGVIVRVDLFRQEGLRLLAVVAEGQRAELRLPVGGVERFVPPRHEAEAPESGPEPFAVAPAAMPEGMDPIGDHRLEAIFQAHRDLAPAAGLSGLERLQRAAALGVGDRPAVAQALAGRRAVQPPAHPLPGTRNSWYAVAVGRTGGSLLTQAFNAYRAAVDVGDYFGEATVSRAFASRQEAVCYLVATEVELADDVFP